MDCGLASPSIRSWALGRVGCAARHPGSSHAIIILLLSWIAVTGCSSTRWGSRSQADVPIGGWRDAVETLFLEFNGDGNLKNFREVSDWIDRYHQRRPAHDAFDKVVVLCLGWNRTPMKMRDDYESLLNAYCLFDKEYPSELGGKSRVEQGPDRVHTLAICIVWDSSFRGVANTVEGLSPVPGVAGLVGILPDTALSPLSFWAKARLAP